MQAPWRGCRCPGMRLDLSRRPIPSTVVRAPRGRVGIGETERIEDAALLVHADDHPAAVAPVGHPQ